MQKTKCRMQCEVFSRENEIWRNIPTIPTHQASSFGRIRSKDRVEILRTKLNKFCGRRDGKMMSLFKSDRGYVGVSVNDRSYGVHRLVALAFHGLPNDKQTQVNHIDGNKGNNFPENLEWVTVSENELHSYRVLGKVPWNKGKICHNISVAKLGHKVSDSQIQKHKETWKNKNVEDKEISFELYKLGYSHDKIKKIMNFKSTNVVHCRIKKYMIDNDIKFVKRYTRYTNKEKNLFKQIFRLKNSGMTWKELALHLNMPMSTIRDDYKKSTLIFKNVA